jgi:prophage antirepressor-like protein
MNNLVKTFNDQDIRIINQPNGEVWFVAKDVCNALGIVQTSKAVERLDEDEKGVHSMPTLGGNQNMTIISESGLYKIIFQSNKPNAKLFTNWVTKEVLPSIRKTGSYESAPAVQKRTIHLSVDMVLACIEINDKTDRLKMAAALLGIDVNPALQRFAIEDTFKNLANKFSTAK